MDIKTSPGTNVTFLPYLRRIKAIGQRQVRLERSRPIAKAPFNSLAASGPQPTHRRLQAMGLQVRALATVLARWRTWIQQNYDLGRVGDGMLKELHSFLRTRGPESAVPKFGR